MDYCKRCVYPENAKPAIIFDDDGICSGCRYHESRHRIDWSERREMLDELLTEYREDARESDRPYDCIIPVSGGKDSHFQVHLIKNVYGLEPLLVTFNHAFNNRLGLRNLRNLVDVFGCDLIRFTANPESVRKVSRYMLEEVGDLTWHYHAGIRTFPFQVAVEKEIPLIIWGEHGFAELTGMFTLDDMVEFTKWTRQEHDMRGYEPEDIAEADNDITMQDLRPYVYPSDAEIEDVGVRGIYLSNFVYWNAKDHADLVIDKYNFATVQGRRDRTFVLYNKTDDHANDVHDYLKFLKFGYGRATQDASTEIRHGRMTREKGAEMVERYDATTPSTLKVYCDFLGITVDQFYEWIAPMRDGDIWEQDKDGEWQMTDHVTDHLDDPGVEEARPDLVPEDERTFSPENAYMYYSEEHWSERDVPAEPDSPPMLEPEDRFLVL